MGVYIKGMEMPKRGHTITITIVGSGQAYVEYFDCRPHAEETIEYAAVPVPPHGDLIDRDALIKDGWLNLHKEVMRVGGYAIHELPLKNPSIPVIIPAEEGE